MEMDIEGDDQISSFSDALLSLIISHLSVLESVRTNILLRRWNNIWISSSCVHFNKSISDQIN